MQAAAFGTSSTPGFSASENFQRNRQMRQSLQASTEIRQVRRRKKKMGGGMPDHRAPEPQRPAVSLKEQEFRVTSWLLLHAQIDDGPAAGGVLGWYDSPQSRFIYPEITGYYLTFLGALNEQDKWGCVTERIATAVRYLSDSWLPQPITRYYLDGNHIRDWRNRFLFAFDFGMVLRGLSHVASVVDCAELVDRVADELVLFADRAAGLKACLSTTPGPMPPVWSVRPGPYQVKVAAAILLCNLRMPGVLIDAAERVIRLSQSVDSKEITPHTLHPVLYQIEGLILLGTAGGRSALLNLAASLFFEIFEPYRKNGRASALATRSDVAAQVLRAGCLMSSAGQLDPLRWESFFQQLAVALGTFIEPDGSVVFLRNKSNAATHINIWSALFTVQAIEAFENRTREIDQSLLRFFV